MGSLRRGPQKTQLNGRCSPAWSWRWRRAQPRCDQLLVRGPPWVLVGRGKPLWRRMVSLPPPGWHRVPRVPVPKAADLRIQSPCPLHLLQLMLGFQNPLVVFAHMLWSLVSWSEHSCWGAEWANKSRLHSLRRCSVLVSSLEMLTFLAFYLAVPGWKGFHADWASVLAWQLWGTRCSLSHLILSAPLSK